MMYDFTSEIDRSEMGSVKWAIMKMKNPEVEKGIIPYSIADMEFHNAPEIVDAIKESLDNAVLGYSMTFPNYLQSVCNWQKKRFGWEPDPSWIVTTHGVVPALYQMIKVLTQPGDGVIILGPSYYPFYTAVTANGCEVLESPLVNNAGHYEIDFDDLEARAKQEKTKVLMFCSPHNPVGRVWTEEELKRVIRICVDNDIFLLCDEIHQDVIMPGHHHIPVVKADPAITEHCAICTAPSKTFNLAGMEHSNIFIPNAELRQKFYSSWFAMGLHHGSTLSYVATMAAYDRGEAWLDALLKVLNTNRSYIDLFLKDNMPKMKLVPLEGTYLPWIDCHEMGVDDETIKKLCLDAKFYVDDGLQFGQYGGGYYRINMACPTHKLIEGLERLKAEYDKAGF